MQSPTVQNHIANSRIRVRAIYRCCSLADSYAISPPRTLTLFPYTTLFRSETVATALVERDRVHRSVQVIGGQTRPNRTAALQAERAGADRSGIAGQR